MKRSTLILLGLLLLCGLAWARGPLTDADRVKAQEAIERVYYGHRIWPKENPGLKPSFEAMTPRSTIEARVSDSLKKDALLQTYWKRTIKPAQLQAELNRMVRDTRDPAMLAELFAVLGNDPILIADCLVRPLLTDRLLRQAYAHDARFHGTLQSEAMKLRAGLMPDNFAALGGAFYHPVEIHGGEGPLPGGRPVLDSKALWLSKAEFTRAAEEFPREGTIGPVEETEEAFLIRWTSHRTETSFEGGVIVLEKIPFDVWFRGEALTAAADAPAPSSAVYTLNPIGSPGPRALSDWWTSIQPEIPGRIGFVAVWTGDEMIVWGGISGVILNTGGRYDPATDTWTITSTGANCPTGRYFPTAVWTGTEMIVWGGVEGTTPLANTGGRYDPATDTWAPTSAGAGCPSGRALHTAVWTGSEMIVWGGVDLGGSPANSGGRYSPSSDAWTATPTDAGCPAGRMWHTAVWTGSAMIVWGGEDGAYNPMNTGGRYDPAADAWAATSTGAGCPAARQYHSSVWTGSTMIVWGGDDGTGDLNTGGRYDPAADAWIPTSTAGACPSARHYQTAVWTGAEMIVWGGDDGDPTNTGGRYDPSTDLWAATSTAGDCPVGRFWHAAVWTGSEMIVWSGGQSLLGLFDGGRYDPATDSWTAINPNGDFPTVALAHTAVWTGTEMILWGGSGVAGITNAGWRYIPALDAWTPVSRGAGCPTGRTYHRVVWTGSRMIVWGGQDGTGNPLNSGGRYDPAADAWAATSTAGACPSTRFNHTVVWTGTEMIVWGGGPNTSTPLNTGGRYDPAADAWAATSIAGACPSVRIYHTAVWTGAEMIVWGGYDSTTSTIHNSGGRYAPGTDSWIPTASAADNPAIRALHTAVWTGSEMIVWGGLTTGITNAGDRYIPATDTWAVTSASGDCPAGRVYHTAVWTGAKMIVWGGLNGSTSFNTGGQYDPVTDCWVATSTDGECPGSMFLHSAVWTGSTMIVWGAAMFPLAGGFGGGIYHPSLPLTCATTPFPSAGAIDVAVSVTLTWAPVAGATSYDVYLGVTLPALPTATVTVPAYAPGNLAISTTYQWMVVPRYDCVSAAGCAVWSFTTDSCADIPAAFVNVAPPDGTTGLSSPVLLQWEPAPLADRYEVYVGTSPGGKALVATTTETSYLLENLTEGTPYYWQIIALNDCGFKLGREWVFNTAGGGPGLGTQFVAAVARITGAAGSDWRTDGMLYNRSDRSLAYELIFTPAEGPGGRDEHVYSGTLEAGRAMAVENLVETLFGITAGAGNLRLESEEAIPITTRTYNTTDQGTYGQFVAGVGAASAVGSAPVRVGETGHLLGIRQNAAYRTNIGFTEVQGKPTAFTVRFYDPSGALIATVADTVDGLGWWQKNILQFGVSGNNDVRAEFEVTSGGALLGYASVADSTSNDAYYIPAQKAAQVAGQTHQLFAVVSRSKGGHGTDWRSDIHCYNPDAAEQSVALEFVSKAGTAAGAFLLAPGQSAVFGDVVTRLFPQVAGDAVGGLHLRSPRGVLCVSRTYNQTDQGTYGQFVPLLTPGELLDVEETGDLLQLASDDDYRCNIGLTGFAGGASQVELALYAMDGRQLGVGTFDVPVGGNIQFNAFAALGIGEGFDAARATARVLSGGPVYAYASVVDNRTGDAIFVPAMK